MLDGDTVVLADGRRVRLAAIDCPERGRDGAERAAALVAALLTSASVITLEPARPPRDRYGRLLADLRADGRSVTDALLEAGLAWLYEPRPGHRLDLQSRAVADRRGVFEDLDRIDARAYVSTDSRVHRPDCPWLSDAAPARRGLRGPLRRGLAPCRTCLPWPKATKW